MRLLVLCVPCYVFFGTLEAGDETQSLFCLLSRTGPCSVLSDSFCFAFRLVLCVFFLQGEYFQRKVIFIALHLWTICWRWNSLTRPTFGEDIHVLYKGTGWYGSQLDPELSHSYTCTAASYRRWHLLFRLCRAVGALGWEWFCTIASNH